MATANQLKLNSALQGDGARQTKFEALLVLGSGYTGQETAFTSLVKTASFPSIKNESTALRYRGRSIPLKGITRFDNTWVCSFYLQESHGLKILLEEWMHQASAENHSMGQEQVNTTKIRDEGIYKSIFVVQRDFQDQGNTITYNLRNVYPKSISTVQVDYSQLGAILEIQVEFSYSHYVYSVSQDAETKTLVDKALGAARGAINNQIKGVKGVIDAEAQKVLTKLKDNQTKLASSVVDKIGSKSLSKLVAGKSKGSTIDQGYGLESTPVGQTIAEPGTDLSKMKTPLN